jgi:hypothetical protein
VKFNLGKTPLEKLDFLSRMILVVDKSLAM